jgi:hypothetical protein
MFDCAEFTCRSIDIVIDPEQAGQRDAAGNRSRTERPKPAITAAIMRTLARKSLNGLIQ